MSTVRSNLDDILVPAAELPKCKMNEVGIARDICRLINPRDCRALYAWHMEQDVSRCLLWFPGNLVRDAAQLRLCKLVSPYAGNMYAEAGTSSCLAGEPRMYYRYLHRANEPVVCPCGFFPLSNEHGCRGILQ